MLLPLPQFLPLCPPPPSLAFPLSIATLLFMSMGDERGWKEGNRSILIPLKQFLKLLKKNGMENKKGGLYILFTIYYLLGQIM